MLICEKFLEISLAVLRYHLAAMMGEVCTIMLFLWACLLAAPPSLLLTESSFCNTDNNQTSSET